MIESWQQVAVIVAILAYLIVRSHIGARRAKRLKTEVETIAPQVAGLDTGITAVLHQVENNSGSSLKDAVDRIETGQAELVDLVGEHIKESKVDSARLAALEEKYLDSGEPTP